MIENGADNAGSMSATASKMAFGNTEFGSSSTQERSKISVEKRDDIVKPNVSPSKCGANAETSQASTQAQQPAAKAKEEAKERAVNIIPIKKKPTPTSEAKVTEPPVNIIQVKKKPGPPSPPKQPQSAPTSPPKGGKKRKRIAVLSDSSEDDSSSSSGSDSDEVVEIKDDKAANKPPAQTIPVKRASDSDKKEDVKSVKMKDAKVKKPDFSPKRPRGRPPLNREYSSDLKQSPKESEANKDQVEAVQAQTSASARVEVNQVPQLPAKMFKLPSMKTDKCKVYNFHMMQSRVTVNVSKDIGNLNFPARSKPTLKSLLFAQCHLSCTRSSALTRSKSFIGEPCFRR